MLSMGHDRHNMQNTRSSVDSQSPLTSEMLTSTRRRPDGVSLKAAVVVDSSDSINPRSSHRGGGPSIRSRVTNFIVSQRRKFKNRRRSAVMEVEDMDVFRYLLGQDRNAFTVVMFHAPFCKACKASLPLFEQLASRYNQLKINRIDRKSEQPENDGDDDDDQRPASRRIKFLSVTVTKANSQFLQDTFGVTRFPLAQIYHSQRGLVDERPILRKLFPGFEKQVRSFVGSS